jgi:hypothetical protein
LSLTVRPVMGRRAKISALGTYVPPDVITNQDLEKLVDTNDQWIMERTGIKTRHKLAAGLGVSDICAEAAKKCLAARGIGPDELEVIIVGTVTPDMMYPSTAALVQNKIGAHRPAVASPQNPSRHADVGAGHERVVQRQPIDREVGHIELCVSDIDVMAGVDQSLRESLGFAY